MNQLNLPNYPVKEKLENGQEFLWDIIRKKWIVKQPEEWVRQQLIGYLIEQLKFPKSLMSVEKQIKVNKQVKRYDILMYTSTLKMILMVECKAPSVEVTQATFNQIAQYNLALKVPFLLVTNGIKHFFCEINHEEHSFKFHREILSWKQILEINDKSA